MSAADLGNFTAPLPGIPAVEYVGDLAVGTYRDLAVRPGKVMALVLTSGTAVVSAVVRACKPPLT